MGFARTAFGCVVYPNFSQIFVAGGSVNEYESTNKCERYMVTENKWKTLPDLNESKCKIRKYLNLPKASSLNNKKLRF